MSRKTLTRRTTALLLAVLAAVTLGLAAAESASASPTSEWGMSARNGFVPI